MRLLTVKETKISVNPSTMLGFKELDGKSTYREQRIAACVRLALSDCSGSLVP